jgi:hypothetical protein
MKDMTLETLLAVFQEMFGSGLFWTLLAGAVAVTTLYLYVLFRDRALSLRKFFWAQVSMPVGAVAAVMFVFAVTESGLRDMGGPIDVVVLLAIAALGAVGMAILVYTAQSLFRRPGD